MAQTELTESERAREIFERIKARAGKWYPTALSHYRGEPFKALIASMLSAATREEQTTAACIALFNLADNPFAMQKLSDEQILKAISPVSYPEKKVFYVRDICANLVEIGGEVPHDPTTLMTYKGVGWKVATLSLLIGYGRDEDIPVDVHVERIGKRMGFVDEKIKQPPKVNDALKQVLPREIWAEWNPLMVQFGREVCSLVPRCNVCPVFDLCPRIGVSKKIYESLL